MEGKEVLIIDDEIDFCLLMQSYLRKKNCTVNYALNITDGLEFIELKRPEIIIADTNVTRYLEDILNNKISSIDNYAPSVFLINANSPSGASPQNDEGTLSDKIKKWIQSIRDRFNK
ncbi:MAG: response regulator [Segetibacter sp.]|nr:response regulator [Segetibacter sp.]